MADDARQREVWLDARALSPGERATLNPLLLSAFTTVLTSEELGSSGLPDSQARIAIEVESDAPAECHRRADVLVFTDPKQVGPFADIPARRAYSGVVRHQRDLTAMANILRGFQFEYGIVALEEVTNIPLEFLLAWFQSEGVRILKRTSTISEGEIASRTLERGCDGVLLATRDVGEIARASSFLASESAEKIDLMEWTVTAARSVGSGHRACVDVASLFTQTEGMLVGSTCDAMILMCSETHYLPYMPLRPFRVNAGGIHSYVMGPQNKTGYLGDLRAGARGLAVDIDGSARPVIVGRVKIERRPLLMLTFELEDRSSSIFVQDDWHVRVHGAAGEVLNVTDCKPGTRLLGARYDYARHCGLPVEEQLTEV